MNASLIVFDTPAEPLYALQDEQGRLLRLGFVDGRSPATLRRECSLPGWRIGSGHGYGHASMKLVQQLREYFEGARTEFQLPLLPAGTPFQRRVWDALCEIPYGKTSTYAAIAARIGRPGAQRAVGAANKHNPIAIVVPCHRIIGSDGKLTGYACGLQRKRALLDLEQWGGSARPPYPPRIQRRDR